MTAERDVLVTAGGSSLGQAIVAALAADASVGRVVSVHAAGRVPPQDSERVHHVAADLGRPRQLRELLFADAARHVGCVVYVPEQADTVELPHGRAPDLVATTQQLLLAAEEHPRIERFVMLSTADVYRIDSREPMLIDEDHPLELSPDAPAALRERVQADLVACARIGVARPSIAVLRCSQILAPDASGQLLDYLSSRVCLRPLGYDPMLNVLTLEDAAEAVRLAVRSPARGIFNIPGRDSLPLSELIHAAGRIGVAVPGPALRPLYGLRALTTAFRFRYAPQRKLFHLGAVLDGRKAQQVLGYTPVHDLSRRGPGYWPQRRARLRAARAKTS